MNKRKWTTRVAAMAMVFCMLAGTTSAAFAGEAEVYPEQGQIIVSESEPENLLETDTNSLLETNPDNDIEINSGDDKQMPVGMDNEIAAVGNGFSDTDLMEESLSFDSDAASEEAEEQFTPEEEETDLEPYDDLIPMDTETEADEEAETIAVAEASPVEQAFEAAKTGLDSIIDSQTDAYSRILAVYNCIANSFPETVFTDEEMAQLTQKLLENYGIRSCVLYGIDQTGELVYWNLAEMGGQYYNLDASLDRNIADQMDWTAFLKGGLAPFGYNRDAAFLTEEFLAEYPCAGEDYVIPTLQEEMVILESAGEKEGSENVDPEASANENSESLNEEMQPEEAGQEENTPVIVEEAAEKKDTADASENQKDDTSEDKEKDNLNDGKEKETEDKKSKENEEEVEDAEEAEEAVEAEPMEELNTASAGKSVWFGRYAQSKVTDKKEIAAVSKAAGENHVCTVNGISYYKSYSVDGNELVSYWYRDEPIEWIILGESGGYYKLISKKVLVFGMPGIVKEGNWINNALRYNLNQNYNTSQSTGFLGEAFSKNEQNDMQAHPVKTYDERDKKWLTTSDKVSFLDASEISEVPSSLRIAYPSPYADYSDKGEKAVWWLRGSKYKDGYYYQAYIDTAGKVKYLGDEPITTSNEGERPIIWVKTSSKYLYTSNPGTAVAYPTSIKLNKTSASIYIGDSVTLKATLSPSTAKNKTVKWSSSNTKVATVTSTGHVKGVGQGTVTITAKTANGKTATCKVKVSKKPIIKVMLNKTALTLNEGASQTLKATLLPAKGVDTALTWSSSNKNVVSVDSKGKIKAVRNGTATITVKTKNGKTATCKVTVKGLSVQYRTHVQTYGWQKYVSDGAMSGTQGQAKRLEGINIRLANKGYSGDIKYRTHVQTYGWESTFRKNGEMSGTQGQAKRLEAIQIYLTGDLAKNYDIYYCVHSQTYGWLGWAKNGEMAGTSGLSKRLEGIRIRLVKKGGPAPGSTTNPNIVAKGGTGSLMVF